MRMVKPEAEYILSMSMHLFRVSGHPFIRINMIIIRHKCVQTREYLANEWVSLLERE